MKLVKISIFVSLIFLSSFLFPKPSNAFNLQQSLTSENSIFVKIQEGIEYFFAFKVENKIQVLEKHAEKRLAIAERYAEEGNNERVENTMQNYLQIKERQNSLLGQVDDGKVLGAVETRTINQQVTMEDIKTKIDEDTKHEVIQIQEQVVNQVAKRVVEVNGPEGQTEFFNRVEHVWAPGTGPGGEAGVVIEGGTMQFAPGTSAGGPAGQDIKTIEIKTGGAVNEPVPAQEGSNYAPGTSGDSPGNTIDPGVIEQGDGGTWTIDP